MKILAPSILSADLSDLGSQIKLVDKAGADWIHCDIMDGHFVPNITFGPVLVKAAKKNTSLPLDVHLMIKNPDNFIDEFIKAGASYITVHLEEVVHLNRTINKIKESGARAGVVLNPSTPVHLIKDVAEYIDLLLIMSVNPGFGGQSFISNSLRKIKEAVDMREQMNGSYLIEVDGGISSETITAVKDAGCDVFVAGSAIFHAKDISKAVMQLKDLLKS
jgi:ribulose-phosphate 3-epimerase